MAMRAPVFIVGCPRSGTSFLYHLLLSAGGFAQFRTQMNVFDVLEPIYGDLGVLKNKKEMMKEWLRSKAFHVSGLDAEEVEAKVLAECRGAGDFLRIVMEMIAQNPAAPPSVKEAAGTLTIWRRGWVGVTTSPIPVD